MNSSSWMESLGFALTLGKGGWFNSKESLYIEQACIGLIGYEKFKAVQEADELYKGAKNMLRDRLESETGTDPAPRYPVEAPLF